MTRGLSIESRVSHDAAVLGLRRFWSHTAHRVGPGERATRNAKTRPWPCVARCSTLYMCRGALSCRRGVARVARPLPITSYIEVYLAPLLYTFQPHSDGKNKKKLPNLTCFQARPATIRHPHRAPLRVWRQRLLPRRPVRLLRASASHRAPRRAMRRRVRTSSRRGRTSSTTRARVARGGYGSMCAHAVSAS